MNVATASLGGPSSQLNSQSGANPLREAFDSFVGETFYGQMIASMRKTTGKPAYFHGGRAEEIFQSQFDQMVAQKLSASNAHSFTGPMFQQFVTQTNPGADPMDDAPLLPAAEPTATISATYESQPWEGLLSAGRR